MQGDVRESGGIDFAEFCADVARRTGARAGDLRTARNLVADLGLSEVTLFQLVMALQEINPYFSLPEQLDVREASMEDLFHFCTVMGPDHLEPEP